MLGGEPNCKELGQTNAKAQAADAKRRYPRTYPQGCPRKLWMGDIDQKTMQPCRNQIEDVFPI